jgi:CHAD domain-containing protein
MSARDVHNLRREARRLQVRLELSNAVLSDAVSWKTMRTVATQLRSLGPLRDSQVQLKLLKKIGLNVPDPRSFREYLKRRRRHLARTARSLIKKRHLGGRILSLQANLVACPSGPVAERRIKYLIRHAVLSSRRLARVALYKARAGTIDLHRARIVLKHYSLISDVLSSLRTDAVVKERGQLLRRVAVLGHVHDLDVLLARIAIAARKHFLTKKSQIKLRDTLIDSRAAAFGLLDPTHGTRTAAPSNRPARRSARA